MQERRLKRLGLLDDDGRSTYDGVAQPSYIICLHVTEQCLQSSLAAAHASHALKHDDDGKLVIMLRSLRRVVCSADFFKDGIA